MQPCGRRRPVIRPYVVDVAEVQGVCAEDWAWTKALPSPKRGIGLVAEQCVRTQSPCRPRCPRSIAVPVIVSCACLPICAQERSKRKRAEGAHAFPAYADGALPPLHGLGDDRRGGNRGRKR